MLLPQDHVWQKHRKHHWVYFFSLSFSLLMKILDAIYNNGLLPLSGILATTIMTTIMTIVMVTSELEWRRLPFTLMSSFYLSINNVINFPLWWSQQPHRGSRMHNGDPSATTGSQAAMSLKTGPPDDGWAQTTIVGPWYVYFVLFSFFSTNRVFFFYIGVTMALWYVFLIAFFLFFEC